jgi:hypothetical protein
MAAQQTKSSVCEVRPESLRSQVGLPSVYCSKHRTSHSNRLGEEDMEPEAVEYRRAERDNFVYNLLSREWQSVKDLVLLGSIRFGTVRASLRRLEQDNLIQRGWDGNARFGRNVYRIAE